MRACVDDVYMGRVVFPAAVRQAHENADNTGVDKRGMREIDRDEVETRMGGGSVRCLARQNGSNARFFLHDEFDIYNNGRLFEAL